MRPIQPSPSPWGAVSFPSPHGTLTHGTLPPSKPDPAMTHVARAPRVATRVATRAPVARVVARVPRVHELPPRQRPRERLRAEGAAALSVRELMAILVGSGGASASVVEVADRILAAGSGRLRTLARAEPGELERISGVGRATAARVVAALELGLRALEEAEPERPRIQGPSDVHDLMAPRLRDLTHEEFHVLLLNTQNRVLRDVTVTRGILDAALIHPREVFRPAILASAAAVVLVHNHPSGDPTPSPEDRLVSRQIREAGQAVGIRVLDHVVVGEGRWASAMDR